MCPSIKIICLNLGVGVFKGVVRGLVRGGLSLGKEKSSGFRAKFICCNVVMGE